MTASIVKTCTQLTTPGWRYHAIHMASSPASSHAAPVTTTRWNSPIGPLLLAARGPKVAGVWFQDQTGIPPWAHPAPALSPTPVLQQLIEQLGAYFQGQRRAFDLPLDVSCGTVFQQAVWEALRSIPYGHTTSYQHIAQAIGRPLAVRAVGGAVGRNPIGIVLPCHRVLGARGALTGYTGGLERKVALLELEHAWPLA